MRYFERTYHLVPWCSGITSPLQLIGARSEKAVGSKPTGTIVHAFCNMMITLLPPKLSARRCSVSLCQWDPRPAKSANLQATLIQNAPSHQGVELVRNCTLCRARITCWWAVGPVRGLIHQLLYSCAVRAPHSTRRLHGLRNTNHPPKVPSPVRYSSWAYPLHVSKHPQHTCCPSASCALQATRGHVQHSIPS